MTYAQGFSDGERAAYADKRGQTRDGQHTLMSAGFSVALAEYWRGYRDAYFPRSVTW
jgi:hypothetical protein